MRMCSVFFCFFLLALTSCQKKTTASTEDADVVIRNAHVYTVDAQRPWAQAVAIKGDRIAWVGDENAAKSHVGQSTKVVDADGRVVLPGFIDSHFHVLLGGNPDVLRIENANSVAEIQRQVAGVRAETSRAYLDRSRRMELFCVSEWNAADLERLAGADGWAAGISGGV